MKKFLVLVLSLLLTLSFAAGCAQTTIGGNSGGSSGSSSSAGSSSGGSSSGGSTDAQTEDSYTVTLQFPSGTTSLPALTGIYAIWSNSNSVYYAEFNAYGVAYCNDLDGEYRVTLSATPDGYTYNPNIYEADGGESGRDVAIYMYAITEFTGGNGSAPNQGLRALASMSKNENFKVYRIEFNSASTEYYFQFTPLYSGTYSIETYVNTYENDINPSLKKYPSTVYWSTYTSATSGGESGTYTKNVYYEFDISDSQLSSSGFMFSISITSATGGYPKYVDFAITWEDDYSDADMYAQYGGAYVSVDVPDNISTDWTTPSGSYTMLLDSSLMGGNFSTTTVCGDGVTRTCVAYNSADGFYYYNPNPTQASDSEIDFNDGNWTLLFVQIKDTYFSYGNKTISYLYGLLQAMENGFQYTYRLSVTVDGVTKNLNYYNLLTAYQTAANSDYCYPVTEELKDCLMNVSVGKQYFYDGSGSLEKGGTAGVSFTATHDDQWLYACGVYC